MDIKKVLDNPRRSAMLAMLPHLEIEQQKKMAMMMKIIETREMMRYYENVDTSVARGNKCKKALINDIMPYMDAGAQKQMQGVLQMLEMQELFAES